MLRDPQVVHNALNVPGAAPQLGEIFHASGYAPRVLRYEVYNAKGRLLFTSGQANLRLDGPPLNVTNNAAWELSSKVYTRPSYHRFKSMTAKNIGISRMTRRLKKTSG